MSACHMNFTRSTTLRRIERIRALLREHDLLTAPEIAARVYLTDDILREYLRHMQSRNLIHHPQWTHDPVAGKRAFPRPQWRVGPGPNVPRPPRRTPDELAAQQRRTDRTRRLRAEGYSAEQIRVAGSRLRVSGARASPTHEQAIAILRLREAGLKWKDIAIKVGVSLSTAHNYYRAVSRGAD